MENARNLILVSIFILALGLSSTAHADELFTKNSYFGIQKDSEVTKLQEFLTSEGLYSGPITGNFFSLTLKGVKDFQTREGISPAAGYFGPLTRARANQILGAQVQGSNEQAVAETGTTPTPAPTPKTTNDVVASLQAQIDLLMQQLALLQQQQSSIAQIQQNTQQIQQNTAPQLPAPILIFSASPTSITSPGSSILSWSSVNSSSCSASGVWSGAKNTSGSESVSPSQSGTYFLTCSGAGGSVIRSATISVATTVSPPSPPFGSITLTLANDSRSSAAVPGATSVVLAKFNAKPNGESYELRQVSFYIAASTTAGAHALTGTVYVKVNGVIVYSVGASTFSTGVPMTVSLSSYPILAAGVDNAITIEVSSIPSTATFIDSYTITNFDLVQAKRLITNDIIDPGVGAVSGLTIPVLSAALTVTTLSTPGIGSVVVGTTGYEYATFQLNAQAGGEDVKVSSIVVDHVEAGNLTEVGNLYLYKNNETSPLTTTASTGTNASLVTFTFTSPILVTRATPVTLHLRADALSGTNPHTFAITLSTSAVAATGASTGNSLTCGTDITFAGSGQAQTHGTGSLTLSLVSGSGASPASDQVVNVGTSGVTFFAFKMFSRIETQKIMSLKLTAFSPGGTLALGTLKNFRLYADNASLPFAQASQFDVCAAGTCTVTFTATDNLLAAPVPVTGVTVYVKGDIGAGGVADLGNSYKFGIASTNDIFVKGSVSGTTTATITGTPTANGITYVVPQSVVVEAVSPTVGTNVGTGAGQTVGIFKITNNGNSAILLSPSTLSFTNGGSASSNLSFKIYASGVGGGQSDTSGWNSGVGYQAVTGTTGMSSTVSFASTAITAAEQQIDGGSWRYFTIKTTAAADNNNTFQFSVSALGNIRFNVAESSLGYSGNPSSDSDLSDTIMGLYTSGTPALSTVTAKT